MGRLPTTDRGQSFTATNGHRGDRSFRAECGSPDDDGHFRDGARGGTTITLTGLIGTGSGLGAVPSGLGPAAYPEPPLGKRSTAFDNTSARRSVSGSRPVIAARLTRTSLHPMQEVAARLGWTVTAIVSDEGNSGGQTAPSGGNHTIRQAAFEYSVMPFSSYV
jgi:hypothetical protein